MTDPVEKEVWVPVAPAVAFRRFTEELRDWWPMATHSKSLAKCQDVRFQVEDVEDQEPPGERAGEVRNRYDSGWLPVLNLFATKLAA